MRLITAICFLLAATSLASAQQEEDASRVRGELEAAKRRATEESHLLRHRFTPGETLRWTVTHVATVETRVKGNTQETKSRTISTKAWRVAEVDESGNATIVHSVEDIDLWQHLSDRPEERYNSRTDASPPPIFKPVAETIGVPLTTFVFSPTGQVLRRESDQAPIEIGFGPVIMPLPDTPVRLGGKWNAPSELRIRVDDGSVKVIKLRHLYELESVTGRVATILVRTQVLTPIADPKIQVKIMQHKTSGRIRFEIEAGRVLEQQIDLDESVIGFAGPDSRREFLARLTEKWIDTPPAAATRAGARR